jgi:hypothetical protein
MHGNEAPIHGNESMITPGNEFSNPSDSAQMEASHIAVIQQVMSGFSLSPTAIPSWAQNLPEDVWKKELLDGIRRQQK